MQTSKRSSFVSKRIFPKGMGFYEALRRIVRVNPKDLTGPPKPDIKDSKKSDPVR